MTTITPTRFRGPTDGNDEDPEQGYKEFRYLKAYRHFVNGRRDHEPSPSGGSGTYSVDANRAEDLKEWFAYETLLDDLHSIYLRCGREVVRDGRAYWPKRYLQHLKIAERQGRDEVLAYVERIVTSEEPKRGLGDLLMAGRPDLTVEALVVNTTKPYQGWFDAPMVAIAGERLGRSTSPDGQPDPRRRARPLGDHLGAFEHEQLDAQRVGARPSA